MTNFSGHPLSQALNGQKGHFLAFLAKFNGQTNGQIPASNSRRKNAGSACYKLDFVSVYGHRSAVPERDGLY